MDFKKNPDADWDYELLSSNINITEDIVVKYAYKPWNLIKLSTKKNMKHRFDKYEIKKNEIYLERKSMSCLTTQSKQNNDDAIS